MYIKEEELNKILQFHPEEKRDLVKYQIEVMNDIIANNQRKYVLTPGYSEAIDMIFTLVMQGKFIEEDK